MPQPSNWTRTIVKDPATGDLILDLGDEVCEAAGWEVGDTLEWIDNKDGTWILRKKNTTLATTVTEQKL